MRRCLLATLLVVSCIHAPAQVTGYPLYGGSGKRLPANQVAALVASMPGGASVGGGSGAFITTVDGRDVSTLDTAFELLPGCHIVRTASDLVVANEALVWRGEIGSRTFAFLMRPGNTYVVKVELQESMGSTARLVVSATEESAEGKELQRIPPAQSAADVQACLRSGSRGVRAPSASASTSAP